MARIFKMRLSDKLHVPGCILLIAAIGLLQGCTGARQQLLSRPVAIENKVTKHGRLDLDGAQIFVRPANNLIIGSGVNWFGFNDIDAQSPSRRYSYYPDAMRLDQPVSKFYVEVFVKSERELKLDPKEVTVTSKDLGVIKPTSYLGPLKMHSTVNYTLPLCLPDLKLEKKIGSPFFVPKNQSLCFALVYNVRPPLPSEKFVINFNAVSIDGKTIDIVPVEYVESNEVSLRP